MFDHAPLGTFPTSTLHTHLVGTHIELRLQPGRYDVHVLARSANIIRMLSGMSGLAYL